MEIITGATYAYFNRVESEWTMVGLIGDKSVREIIARRSAMGHKLCKDYAFKREA